MDTLPTASITAPSPTVASALTVSVACKPKKLELVLLEEALAASLMLPSPLTRASPVAPALLVGSAIIILPFSSAVAVRRSFFTFTSVTKPAVLTVVSNMTPVFKIGAALAPWSFVTLMYAARKSIPVAVLILP